MSLETEISILREALLVLNGTIKGLSQEIKDLKAQQAAPVVAPPAPSPQADWVQQEKKAEQPDPLPPVDPGDQRSPTWTPKKKRGRPAKKKQDPEVPPLNSESAVPEAPLSAPPAEPIVATFQGEPAPTLVYKDISEAVRGICAKGHREEAVALLGSFGVRNTRDLAQEHYPAFMKGASALMQSVS